MRDELADIRGVGEDFLVARVGGVEDHLADRVDGGPEGHALEDEAIGKGEHRPMAGAQVHQLDLELSKARDRPNGGSIGTGNLARIVGDRHAMHDPAPDDSEIDAAVQLPALEGAVATLRDEARRIDRPLRLGIDDREIGG